MKEIVTIVAPDGRKIRATFDGWQWLGDSHGMQPQITLRQPAPPVTRATNSTTYAVSLAAAGYILPDFGAPTD
ncbi:MAG: hypothetical protein ABI651_16945 [Verrucomicrobiota bacterium]